MKWFNRNTSIKLRKEQYVARQKNGSQIQSDHLVTNNNCWKQKNTEKQKKEQVKSSDGQQLNKEQWEFSDQETNREISPLASTKQESMKHHNDDDYDGKDDESYI